MIKRKITRYLQKCAHNYPTVTIIGPRQSGKTTLAKMVFPDHTYVNLENPEIREIALDDPKGFFAHYKAPLIIDEVQRVPELLSWIQVFVDEDPTQGKFILTGSHQLKLHEAISQSLAGRTALLRLLPLSCEELKKAKELGDKNDLLHKGFLPRIYNEKQDPTDVYRNYFQTYVERDVRQLIQLKSLDIFQRFMKLLSGRIGQPVNLNSLSNDVGVSSVTLNEWLSVLEASFIIFKLQPYYNNFGKRLIKSPKIYFVDVGLACWLLGITSPEQALRDPLHGNIFENLVIGEALKAQHNNGRDPNLYFWRDNNQNEVDLILDNQRQLTPIEIKSSQTWNKNFTKGIEWFQKNVPSATKGWVVYAGEMTPEQDHFKSVYFTDIANELTCQN